MKYMSKNNFEKVKNYVLELGYTPKEAENITINAFVIARQFKITVEEVLYKLGGKDK